MIPRRYILEWRQFAPWPEDAQVEQDLIIEKALVELFSNPYLKERLAFRGGTALHKLFLKPQVRYSEDIDLVQIKSEPIKNTLNAIRDSLAFLGEARVRQKANNNTLIFQFISESAPYINMRLKIEINCREHFSVLGYKKMEHSIQNSWLSGSFHLLSYEAEEILGTKLRALYQRKKGRDLFDIYYALTKLNLDTDKLLYCYKKYMQFSVNKGPSRKQFLNNMSEKLDDPDFEGDIYGLLRPGVNYKQEEAYQLVRSTLLEKI